MMVLTWYSNQPDEMCGLYWFMGQLNQWKVHDGQVFIVMLPEWETDEKGNILRKSSRGEVAPEEWRRYLDLQKPCCLYFGGSFDGKKNFNSCFGLGTVYYCGRLQKGTGGIA